MKDMKKWGLYLGIISVVIAIFVFVSGIPNMGQLMHTLVHNSSSSAIVKNTPNQPDSTTINTPRQEPIESNLSSSVAPSLRLVKMVPTFRPDG